LGLTIAKQLVEGQSGTLKVTSKLGEGSVFSFRLTFQKTDLHIPIEESLPEIEKDKRKIRVLVAEDVVLNQLLIKTLLDGFGFEWEIAGNGEIAVEKLQSSSFDIILMDLQMPVMDGYEATKQIRSVLNSHIPIIALTADVTTMDRGKCSVLGMDDYLAKPFDEKDLFNKIRKWTDPSPKRIQLTGRNSRNTKFTGKDDRLTHFEYLDRITSSDQELMREVIIMYLGETPKYLDAILGSLETKDWKGLYQAAHKIIPSFAVVGIEPEYSAIALDIQKFADIESKRHLLPDLVFELQNLIHRITEELTESIGTSTIKVNEY
jgi:CheY-like chemotaxis protein